MKKQLIVIVSCIVGLMFASRVDAQVPSRVEVAPDIGAAIVVDLPGVGDYDLYDYGITAELQFRDWVSDPWGYALSIGYGEWKSNKSAKDPGAGLYDFSGNLEVIPFGGSLLFSVYDDGDWRITLDAGVRYVITDSKIKARNRDEGGTRTYDVNIDDALQYSLGATADYAISANTSWSFGLGYRDDFSRGEISTERGPARDNIMEAFFLTAAIRLAL